MSKLVLTILDQVNFHVDGLSSKEIRTIQDKTSLPEKGAFTTAAFKAKIWDGRTSLFNDDGVGFLYELDLVLDCIENLGYNLDRDVELVFEQKEFSPDIDPIDEDYLKEFIGFSYRDYQTNGVNSIIKNHKGILDIGTNGGKSLLCAGISRVFDPYLKSVVIVPSEHLVNQTFADYSKTDLNVVAMTADVKPSKRKDMVKNARHVIITTKLFMNIVEYFEDEDWAIIVDEIHHCGPVMCDILRSNMRHCPVRVGLSATIPKEKADPFKRNKIFSHIGGGILEHVRQKELIDRGISSKLNIKMISTVHREIDELSREKEFDWSVEESYLLNNIPRIHAIGDFIKSQDVKNTLILCHAGLAIKLGEYLGVDVIVDETPTEKRKEWFAKFDDRDDYILIATFGCGGTGISVNRIFREYLIDVGKNETYILQGIGRGLRRDGVINEIEVVDISAKTKYSERHRKDRVKIYKREEFPFEECSFDIFVGE